MQYNSVCNHVSDWKNQMTTKWKSNSLITCMITDRIGQHKVLLTIITSTISEKKKVRWSVIYNGDRTEYSPIQSVIMQVINKIGWPQSGNPICRSLTWLQTELDNTKSCCQLIITITISEKKKYILDKQLQLGQCLKQKIFRNFVLGKWLLLWLLWSILSLVDLADWT